MDFNISGFREVYRSLKVLRKKDEDQKTEDLDDQAHVPHINLYEVSGDLCVYLSI